MTTGHRSVFVTLDGPSDAGKTTTTEHLHRCLVVQGYSVHTTTEPSPGQLGTIARHGTDTYAGHTLACLVAADRYHHLVTDIRPNLAAGRIVLCDRYVASSYVLQRMDSVPIEFIEAINTAAEVPDLAVILTADPEVTAHRLDKRGAHSRFAAGITASRIEDHLYRDTAERLAERGYPLLTIDTTHTPPAQVTAMIAIRIARLADFPQTTTPTT